MVQQKLSTGISREEIGKDLEDWKSLVCEKAEALKRQRRMEEYVKKDWLISREDGKRSRFEFAPKHSDIYVWKRFISACDYFFRTGK